jgi:hypothetical protein
MYLTGVNFYTDVRGSIVNPAMERQNDQLKSGVTSFMAYAEKALDGPPSAADKAVIACAYNTFESWAQAGALTKRPPKFDRQGIIDTHQFLIGLNVLALKFKASGYPIGAAVMQWLRTLNDQEIQYFMTSPRSGNLYYWSGAAIALFAVLSHDNAAINYQNQVWNDAMSSIAPDGSLASEMKRGGRTLIYHMYSLSAILVQRAARQALGFQTSPSDMARLKSLAALIGRVLCDPRVMEGAAQATTMEKPADWGFRVPVAFGADLLTPDWSRCGISHPTGADVPAGGRANRTAALLHQMVH